MQSDTNSQKKNVTAGAFALITAACLKLKSLGWLLGGLVTMIASIGVFAMQDGLPYAIALVLLIYIHESGHWIWMRALGLQPKAPMFIPGLGAFVAMTKLPESESIHAWVALAGPLIGGVGCAVLYAVGVHTNNKWLTDSGNTGFWLNLFQLVPAKPLDGGFVVQAISRWLLVPGTIMLFLLAMALGWSPLLMVIAILSFLSWFRPTARRTSGDTLSGDQPNVILPATWWERLLIAVAYLSLVCALAFGYFVSSSLLNP